MESQNNSGSGKTPTKHNAAFIARQPIVDAQGRAIAYELLFRNARTERAVVGDSQAASAEVIVGTFLEFGFDELSGGNRVFLNVCRDFLVSGQLHGLPKEHVGIEVLEDVAADEEVLSALRSLRERGYLIVLDDYVEGDDKRPLIALADIVKVDLPAHDSAALARVVERLRRYPVKLLAEKVESNEQFEYCKSLGFDYFQGFFFLRPELRSVNRVVSNRSAAMRLLAVVNDENATLAQLADVVRSDAAITHKVLRFVNSPLNQTRFKRTVDSIEHAVMLLGRTNLAQLTTFLVLARIDGKPSVLFHAALLRARMCELVAQAIQKGVPAKLFTVGMVSLFDAFLDESMQAVVSKLPLADDVKEAIIGQEGWMGEVLRCVTAFQQGEWDLVESSALDGAMLRSCYRQALSWTDRINQLYA